MKFAILTPEGNAYVGGVKSLLVSGKSENVTIVYEREFGLRQPYIRTDIVSASKPNSFCNILVLVFISIKKKLSVLQSST